MEHSGAIPPNTTFSFSVDQADDGMRLDIYLSNQFPAYSRSFFQGLIKGGRTKLNQNVVTKTSTPLKRYDAVTIQFPPPHTIEPKTFVEKDLGVEVIHEHEHFFIINKPAGLLVHPPSEASTAITLIDWLLTHFNEIRSVGYANRPGIVHRLDKDTSGLMIISRTPHAHLVFSNLFKNRALKKSYLAIVHGYPQRKGMVDYPIARDKIHRNKMVALAPNDTGKNAAGKIRPATTHYHVQEYFSDEYALVKAKPVTGRTHQVRVHLTAIGHPLVGDPVYGRKSKLIKRHALHAYTLEFDFDGKPFSFVKEPPEDIAKLIQQLKKIN